MAVRNSCKVLEADEGEEGGEAVVGGQAVKSVECDYGWIGGERRWGKPVKEIRWVPVGLKGAKDQWLHLACGDIIVKLRGGRVVLPGGERGRLPD